METVFNGLVFVHHNQLYLESRDEDYFDQLTEGRAGQANGLCGAAVPGLLFLTTGLHTGNVAFTVEIHAGAPSVTDEWEDVVEASFRPATDGGAVLVQWATDTSWPIPLERRDYRVRYCASGMDAALARDTLLEGESPIDRYLLQLWPAPPERDRVVRQGSEIAEYWHGVAKSAPPPPTAEQRDAALREAELVARRQAEDARRRDEAARRLAESRRWGGRPPSDRLREVGVAWSAAQLDRDLVDAVAETDEATQRAIACWAARQAMTAASMAELASVAPALAALDRAEALPAPFDDFTAAWQVLLGDGSFPITAVASWDGQHERISQQHAAIPAVFSAAEADPLSAALGAIWHAGVTFGAGYRRFLDELRAGFPQLSW